MDIDRDEKLLLLLLCVALLSILALCIYLLWHGRSLKKRIKEVLKENKQETAERCTPRSTVTVEYENERTDEQKTQKQLQLLMKRHEELEQMMKEESKAKQEALAAKEEALIRLSERLSGNLMDNNPDIVDLSDINRPTNLVEKFSSLYDNEWTDAFEGLQKIPGYESEYKVIHLLLNILLDCFQICRNMAGKQLASGLKLGNSAVIIKNMPPPLNKIVKNTRKKQFEADLILLQKMVRRKFQNDRKEVLQSGPVGKYIRHCTEISWLMAIQDPPMAILTEIGVGCRYDISKYREYTKQGEFVVYVVWPAVLIQDGGQLMSRGIVQCRDERLV